MPEILKQYSSFLYLMAAVSALLFFVSIALVPFFLVRIPHDYFSRRSNKSSDEKMSAIRMICFVLKNCGAWILLLCGVAMLVLPGQGILTIFIALVIMDFPGKRYLEIRIITIPLLLSTINKFRKRAGVPPLEPPDTKTEN